MNDAREMRTTCPYCGVGCGILARRQADGTVAVRGDPEHPANFGRLCSKGAALGETVDLEGRLLYPEIRGQRVDWDRALEAVSDGFRRVIDEHGPEAVAFYVSGQLLTEDYYVANKLMKGFIGSANIDTNSRLCMSSSVTGHKRAFGEDVVPGHYGDLEQAELVVLAGSNLAWCHPVLYQRIRAARAGHDRHKLVVIDPRRTASCDDADLHLPLAPGTDTVLFNGLLVHLHDHDQIRPDFLEDHTRGYWAAVREAREVAPNIPTVARRCGLTEEQVAGFYRLYTATDRTVTVWSQGVNQSSFGSDKVNAIINCHLATGRIGRPGMGPFSVTGQPNAMGGREVGGLASMLAAHMDFEPEARERVGRFWQAPNLVSGPGLKAVELFEAIEAGTVKAVWIMATNPVVSLPDADRAREALARCPLVVVSDLVADTDTLRLAHIRLPALGWGEKDGTVTNSERRISRQRAFLEAPGQARPDWWIVTQVARRLGFGAAFPYERVEQVFREHAALSAFENAGRRAFDIGALTDLDDAGYRDLAPIQWPLPAGSAQGRERLYGAGGFNTPDRRARFVAVGERRPAHVPEACFPLVLNTGRVRDHWHTLTRTGKSPRLSAHVPEPYGELHPADALARGVEHDQLIAITSRWGEVIVRARVSDEQRPGSVFVPMHWGAVHSATGRIDGVVNPVTDPLSGQPESKHTPVRVAPWRPTWQGFLLSRRPLELNDEAGSVLTYRVTVRGRAHWRYELAGEGEREALHRWLRERCPQQGSLEWIDYLDRAAGRYRGAALVEGELLYCAFVAPDHRLPPRSWLGELFERDALALEERRSLLMGRPGRGQCDQGPTVCACFGVGSHTLVAAIREQGLNSPEAVGEVLKAGTNCGSCVPEIRRLIQGRDAA